MDCTRGRRRITGASALCGAASRRPSCASSHQVMIMEQGIVFRVLFLLLRLICMGRSILLLGGGTTASGCSFRPLLLGKLREIPVDDGLAETLFEHLFLAVNLVGPAGC